MKEEELRKHATCSFCKKKIGSTGIPLFWTVTVERLGIKIDAVRRQDGMASFLGSSLLANVMGSDEEMTETVLGPITLTMCEDCATANVNLMMAIEDME